MRYDFKNALITIVNSIVLNAPIITTVIIIGVLIIIVLDKFNLIKQPNGRKK